MVWFQGFCPFGSQCRKGSTKQLIAAATREECVLGIAHHLNASSYHYMSWSDANAAADDDEFILQHDGDFDEGSDEVPAEEPVEPANPPGTTSIKGSGRAASGSGISRGGSSAVARGGSSALATARPIGQRSGTVALRSRSVRSPSRSPRLAPDVILRVGEVQQVRRGLGAFCRFEGCKV